MALNKSGKMKLFQDITNWSRDKMRLNEKAINAICEGADNAITYDEQNLTDEQKAQARENIGAANDLEVVKYIAQEVTEEQKVQARTNIGAADAEALGGKKLWTGTAAEYAQLTPSNDTIYFITP